MTEKGKHVVLYLEYNGLGIAHSKICNAIITADSLVTFKDTNIPEVLYLGMYGNDTIKFVIICT